MTRAQSSSSFPRFWLCHAYSRSSPHINLSFCTRFKCALYAYDEPRSFACGEESGNDARGHLISSEDGVRRDPPRLTTREMTLLEFRSDDDANWLSHLASLPSFFHFLHVFCNIAECFYTQALASYCALQSSLSIIHLHCLLGKTRVQEVSSTLNGRIRRRVLHNTTDGTQTSLV